MPTTLQDVISILEQREQTSWDLLQGFRRQQELFCKPSAFNLFEAEKASHNADVYQAQWCAYSDAVKRLKEIDVCASCDTCFSFTSHSCGYDDGAYPTREGIAACSGFSVSDANTKRYPCPVVYTQPNGHPRACLTRRNAVACTNEDCPQYDPFADD